MEEILKQLLIALLTIGTGFLTRYLANLSTQAKAEAGKLENEAARVLSENCIAFIAEAVTNAVDCISQTYVEDLKNTDAFTVESQREALSRAVNTTIAQLTPEVVAWIKTTTNDMPTYLTILIEAEIARKKNKAQ